MKALRKGRGLQTSRIDQRIGPALREVCGVAAADQPAEIRSKVAATLENVASNLPADLRIAVLAGFAITPDARLPLYQDRVSWAATRLARDPRTVRRRIDEGIHQLAQLAVFPIAIATSECGVSASGWHSKDLRVTVALDRTSPEAVEHRRIVADRDDLTEIDLAVTLPTSTPGVHSLPPQVEVFYGGTLSRHRMESSNRFGYALQLPRSLARGETHDYELHFRLPEGQVMRPHFACVPRYPCDAFDLRIRFDRAHLPTRIWMLNGFFQRDIDDPMPSGEILEVDGAGEIHLTFQDLARGLAYGARWAT
jgi:hypothetical protein